MEPKRDEGVRWSSFTPHEHDLRTQNHVRDYDPYNIPDSRPARASGHPLDTSPGPRGPANLKTLLANQQGAGRKKSKPTTVDDHIIQKEGPNWVLLAGGALVTAIGVMIVRKRRPPVCDDKIVEKAVPTPRKGAAGKDQVQQSGISFATTRRESTGSRTSEPSTDSPFSGDAYMISEVVARSQSDGSRVGSDWGDDERIPLSPPPVCSYTQFSKGSNHSGRTIITPTSPPGSYRGVDTSTTEGNEPMPLSPPLSRSGYASRRDMVHRVRQQLKSRDDMIIDMQAQISDQERTIALHQAHCRDLEGRLEAASKTLFESEREIQRLRKAVADYLRSHASNSGNWDSPPATPEFDMRDSEYSEAGIGIFHSPQQATSQDVKALLLEGHRLAEELRNQEEQKRELERVANAKVMESEVLLAKLKDLEAELEQARRAVFEKDLLLDCYETQQDFHADAVDDLKRKLEIREPEHSKGDQASSFIGRPVISGGLESIYFKHTLKSKRDDKEIFKSETCRLPGGAMVQSYVTQSERNTETSPTNVSSVKGWFKTDESSSIGDASEDSDMEDSNPLIHERVLVKLQQEVECLSIALADHSRMISKKRMETSRLVEEFQKHNAVINDIQKKMDESGEGRSETDEQDWEELSRFLSFSNGSASAAQAQELSHKLEQIAKQQRVEEEISELSKHQVKIAELKERVESLLKKCENLHDGNAKVDAVTQHHISNMTAVGLELTKKLSLQEEQARQTSREVRRLSELFQLSSPYVPRSKKEELQKKLLRDSSSESLSPALESGPPEPSNMSHVMSVSQTRFSTGSEEKPKRSGDSLFDCTISVSSAEPAMPKSEGGLTLQMEGQYVYRPGFSGPSIRKSRRGFPIGSGSAKEPLTGAKRRISRSIRKGLSSDFDKELVRSDSNRWVSKACFNLGYGGDSGQLNPAFLEDHHHQELYQNLSSLDVQRAGFGDWMQDVTVFHSAPESESAIQMDDILHQSVDISVSRRQSGSSFSVDDSSVMRMGSPTTKGGHNVSLETSMESTKGSLGRFLFDMEKGNEVFVINQDDGGQDRLEVKEAPLMLPFTKMMAKLDLKQSTSTPSVPDCGSFGSSISGLSLEMVDALRERPQQGRGEKCSASCSDSSHSIDSSFDAVLDSSLLDMVRICSTPSTPAETPESSFMSSHSESKSEGLFQL